MSSRLTIADLPAKYQDQIAAQIGKGKPLGLAKASALRAIDVEHVSKPRLRQSSSNGLNKLETDAWDYLKRTMPGHEIIPHGLRLALANGVNYTPDFVAIDIEEPTHVQCFEVKGPIMRDDAAVKLKTAASKWPGIKFTLLWREGRSGPWEKQEIHP
jgi:hypothetical protein